MGPQKFLYPFLYRAVIYVDCYLGRQKQLRKGIVQANFSKKNHKQKTMSGINKVMILGAGGILAVVGFINLNRSEDIGITLLCFLAAVLFLYGYFGKSGLYCSFSQINQTSRDIVLGEGEQKRDKWTSLQIGTLTFSVIILCFSVGFGVGRTIYRIAN